MQKPGLGFHPIEHQRKMSIQRRVLDYNMFGYTNTERGKVPQCLNTFGNNIIGYFLCFVNRYCNYTNGCSVLFLHVWEFTHVINRDSIYVGSRKFFTYIETGNYFQPVLAKTGILQQGCSQTTHTKKESFVLTVKSQKIFEHID